MGVWLNIKRHLSKDLQCFSGRSRKLDHLTDHMAWWNYMTSVAWSMTNNCTTAAFTHILLLVLCTETVSPRLTMGEQLKSEEWEGAGMGHLKLEKMEKAVVMKQTMVPAIFSSSKCCIYVPSYSSDSSSSPIGACVEADFLLDLAWSKTFLQLWLHWQAKWAIQVCYSLICCLFCVFHLDLVIHKKIVDCCSALHSGPSVSCTLFCATARSPPYFNPTLYQIPTLLLWFIVNLV